MIERVAFRPLRDASRMAPLITALGVSFFLQNAVLLLLGPDIRNYDDLELHPVHDSASTIGPLTISLVRIIVIVTDRRADGGPDRCWWTARSLGTLDAGGLVRP